MNLCYWITFLSCRKLGKSSFYTKCSSYLSDADVPLANTYSLFFKNSEKFLIFSSVYLNIVAKNTVIAVVTKAFIKNRRKPLISILL